MIGLPPGFADEAPDRPTIPIRPAQKNTTATDNIPPHNPMLLESDGHPAIRRIDPDWDPQLIAIRWKRTTSMPLLVGGLGVLFGSWLILSLLTFVEQRFHDLQLVGWLAALSFMVSAALLLRGILGEWASYRELRQVDDIRSALFRGDVATDRNCQPLPALASVRAASLSPSSGCRGVH